MQFALLSFYLLFQLYVTSIHVLGLQGYANKLIDWLQIAIISYPCIQRPR